VNSFIIVLIPNNQADQVEENEVGGSCDMLGRGEKIVQGFWWGSPKERDHSEDRHRWKDRIRNDIWEIV
jgi:hypothetical protein